MIFEEVLLAAPQNHINTTSAHITTVSGKTFIAPSTESGSQGSPSRRSKRSVKRTVMGDVQDGSDEDGGYGNSTSIKPKSTKSRRELPAGAVATLKAWLLSPEHFTHPYPTPQDQVLLMQKTGIDKKQLKNWFTNARRRIWKPMLKKQLEQGKITQTGSGGVVTVPCASPGLIAAPPSGPEYTNHGTPTMVDHTQTMQHNYQQSVQQPQPSQQQYDQFGNPTYVQQHNQYNANSSSSNYAFQQGQFNQQNDSIDQCNSIGSLPQMPGVSPPGCSTNMNKTDSHAVLMELFARDQDLVRQATRNSDTSQSTLHDVNQNGTTNSQLLSQHPMSSKVAGGSTTMNKLGNVPSLNSWPHFSSVSSLNNLGTMTGVKSITNMSGADLVSQGSLNRKGNLAQVKSIENMGRADSYAFLEVFFDSSSGGSTQTQRGVKRDREDDDNVGLSLDGDDASPALATPSVPAEHAIKSSAPIPAPLPADGKDKEGLKRAYDDALAARGLISVSRSSEKLTDLALPAKMQRTISQEYLKSMNACRSTTFATFSFNSNVPQLPASNTIESPLSAHSQSQSNQFLAQTRSQQPRQNFDTSNEITSSAQMDSNDPVEVPVTTRCALCNDINVDTQLRPCGHMFHGRCLKPSIQNAIGAPQCPIDKMTMLSAVLAVPTDENTVKPRN